MEKQKEKEWLSIDEMMNYIQCKSKSTVYTIAKRYKVRKSKLLSMSYFNKKDVDKILAENAVQLGLVA